MRRLTRATPLRSVRVKGVYGQTILDMHQQLTRLLDKRQHGLGHFLAKPSVNNARGEILWYTRAEGEIRRYDDLSEEEQARLRGRLAAKRERVEAIAGDLAASDNRDRAADAASFLRALTLDTLPSEALYLVGGEPVVTDWGCDQVEHSTKLVALTAAAAAVPEPEPAPPPPPLPPSPVAAAPVAVAAAYGPIGWWRWLRWLLLLFLLFLLFAFLLRGCAPIGLTAPWPTLGGVLPPMPAAVSVGQLEQEENLRAELADLGAGLSEQAQACVAPSAEDRLARKGRTKGVVNVSLTWNNYNDLDLIVRPPVGEAIYFQNKNGVNGGFLDIDMNSGTRREAQPIENIKWETEAPPGKYEVSVVLYDIAPGTPGPATTPYTVTVTVHGDEQTFNGTVSRDQKRQVQVVTHFTVP